MMKREVGLVLMMVSSFSYFGVEKVAQWGTLRYLGVSSDAGKGMDVGCDGRPEVKVVW